MCAANSSSDSEPSGEHSVTTMSASPPYQHHCRQPAPAGPRAASVRARTKYMTPNAIAGAICSGTICHGGRVWHPPRAYRRHRRPCESGDPAIADLVAQLLQTTGTLTLIVDEMLRSRRRPLGARRPVRGRRRSTRRAVRCPRRRCWTTTRRRRSRPVTDRAPRRRRDHRAATSTSSHPKPWPATAAAPPRHPARAPEAPMLRPRRDQHDAAQRDHDAGALYAAHALAQQRGGQQDSRHRVQRARDGDRRQLADRRGGVVEEVRAEVEQADARDEREVAAAQRAARRGSAPAARTPR